MGAKRTQYQIVGRYMSGKEVTGYHLQSIDTGKAGKYTKEQVCFLVGRDQVTNCTGQIYNNTVLLRGKGMSLEDLPVQQESTGQLKNTDSIGKIKRGTTNTAAMEQFLIVGTIKSGRNTVGYVIQNAGCGIKKIKRQQVIELVQAGKIGNARVQNYDGKILLRGVGCNLDELPSEQIGDEQSNSGGGTKYANSGNATFEQLRSMYFNNFKGLGKLTKLTNVLNNKNKFGVKYDAGYIVVMLNPNNTATVEWSASNGFDGAKVSTDNPLGTNADETNELNEYISNAIGRINTLIRH